MATDQFELGDPPTEPRARELWLQHAAGFIVFEDIRKYAMERIAPTLPPAARAAVQTGIDDAIYGLMMVMDGVSGRIANRQHAVYVDFIVRLAGENDKVMAEVDLRSGDGMCMGYHGWRAGDFGNTPVGMRRK